jgi:outer membrane protein assembly factor BamB
MTARPAPPWRMVLEPYVLSSLRIILAAIVMALMAKVALAADKGETPIAWPQWRGPTRDSVVPDPGLSWDWKAKPPLEVWKKSVGTGFSSIVVGNGRAYTLGNDEAEDTVHCLDAGTGELIWKHAYPAALQPNLYEGGPNATPALDGESVYTVSKFGRIFCLDAATGKVRWSRDAAKDPGCPPPKWGVAGSPLIYRDLVIFNLGAAGLALHKATGEVAWKSASKPCGYATPVVFDSGRGKAIGIYGNTELVAVDPVDGRQLWSYPWANPAKVNAPDPVFTGNNVFLGAGSDRGCALIQIGKGDPRLIWKNANLSTHASTPLVFDNCVYGFNGPMATCELRCLDLSDGSIKWKTPIGGTFFIVGHTTLILSTTGELIAGDMSPAGFKELARQSILNGKCWTMPSLAGTRLYARNARGGVVCIELPTK